MGTALQGKKVWVLGGASGVGRAVVMALHEAGARVVAGDRDQAGLEALGKACPEVRTVALDITRSDDVERAAVDAIGRLGGIEALVNCVGTNLRERHFDDMGADGWDKVIGTNLSGAYYACRAVLPAMRSQRRGCVVNIASWAARYATHFTGPAYNASKSALVALTETINIEACADGVRACSILPADVNTPLVDQRPNPPSAAARALMLQPDDVAAAVLFVLERPQHVCINELLISPTANPFYLGAATV